MFASPTLRCTQAGSREQDIKAAEQSVADAGAELDQRNWISSGPNGYSDATQSLPKTATGTDGIQALSGSIPNRHSST